MAEAGLVTWRELQSAAPLIAAPGLASLAGVAMLGTLRRDGSPRISPVEPCLQQGELLIGAMVWSQKTADLRRDPRYVLHSTVTGPDSGEAEFKMYGAAVRTEDDSHRSAADAWWSRYPADTAIVFALRVAEAVYVVWDTSAEVMKVQRWSARRGYGERQRRYP
jgi:Pyridoxamine 5'-phosphate oxidase